MDLQALSICPCPPKALLELLSDVKHLNSRDFLGIVQLALVLGTI